MFVQLSVSNYEQLRRACHNRDTSLELNSSHVAGSLKKTHECKSGAMALGKIDNLLSDLNSSINVSFLTCRRAQCKGISSEVVQPSR